MVFFSFLVFLEFRGVLNSDSRVTVQAYGRARGRCGPRTATHRDTVLVTLDL